MASKGNILLGVCGSIAAYKSAYLTRLLVKNTYDVKVILTKAGVGFINPIYFFNLIRQSGTQ